MAEDKSEKATPKKKDDARKKGQVAKSADLNGAVVLLASLFALSAFAPFMYRQIEEATLLVLDLVSTPEVVGREGIGEVLSAAAVPTVLACAPVAATCLISGVLASVAQVGLKATPHAMKPELKKLNPITGAKNIFGSRALFELGKNMVKVVVVGAIGILTVWPQLEELAALVGMPPAVVLPTVAASVLSIAQKAGAAYLVIAAVDWLYQHHKHEKGLRMDMKEIKDEFKQQELPAEVKSQQRRAAMTMSRARMMDAVPTADVIVTNPTHYAVALRYDAGHLAPIVVAKGQDHLALRIREVGGAAGVSVVPDPPLARSLHASVEIGDQIPEELYQAVAQLLAYVYRVAGGRAHGVA